MIVPFAATDHLADEVMKVRNVSMPLAPLDLSSSASRRRFFIDRVVRRGSRGDGTLRLLLDLPARLHRRHGLEVLAALFADVPMCLIGAHAAAAYAPERATQDVDVFTAAQNYDAAVVALIRAGYRRNVELAFPQTALALFGSHWTRDGSAPPLDLVSTRQPWAEEVFRVRAEYTRSGDRVMPLAYLVLMKVDAARSVDQGDLSRILGRLSDHEVDEVVRIVSAHYAHDPAAVEDIRQYAEIGRWEYGTGSPEA